MVKRAVVLCVIMIVAVIFTASAEPAFETETEAQKTLKAYIDAVNTYLEQNGESPINRIFEMYPGFAVIGITAETDAETPEEIEITVLMDDLLLKQIQLRVSNIDRFPVIAASMIKALYGDHISFDEAISIPSERAGKAANEPGNSYTEPIEEMNGTVPRFYYSYYPNQYRDGISWIQMTIIMPFEKDWDGNGMLVGEEYVRGTDPDSGVSEDYEGYYSEDEYNHFEVFSTATPEPDSAASEYDFR